MSVNVEDIPTPKDIAERLVLDNANGERIQRVRWDLLVELAGRANAWGLLSAAVVRANPGMGMWQAVARAHEIVEATL
jgi:hypothetical protein